MRALVTGRWITVELRCEVWVAMLELGGLVNIAIELPS